MMKAARQAALLDVIEQQEIQTQEELASALARHGITVTQATISRDIKELGLIKIVGDNGAYRYASPNRSGSDDSHTQRLTRMLADSMLSATAASNLVVIKTLSASANAAGEAIDTMHWPEVVGTLAGDNTLLVVARTPEEAERLTDRLMAMIR